MPRVSGFFEGESASRSSTTTKACHPQKVPKLSEVLRAKPSQKLRVSQSEKGMRNNSLETGSLFFWRKDALIKNRFRIWNNCFFGT